MIHIQNLKTDQKVSICRVQADINGAPLWFESSDLKLSAAPETFAAAALFPALVAQKDIKIDAPLSLVWMKNLSLLLKIFSKQLPSRIIKIQSEGFPADFSTPSNKSALLLTGDISSFPSQIQRHTSIDHFVFVHGYDIPLRDKTNRDTYKKSIRKTAAKINSKAIIIETNLRDHPLFEGVSWSEAKGCTIAAIAYLIEKDASRFFVTAPLNTASNQTLKSAQLNTGEHFSKENVEIIQVESDSELC